VKIDDWLGRPRKAGRPPRLSDSELLTLAVAQVLTAVLDHDPDLLAERPRPADHRGQRLRIRRAGPLARRAWRAVAATVVSQPHPTPRRTPAQTDPPAHRVVNDTSKGQLDLELHGGRSIEGVTARIAQRLLAMTAAIWHNRATGQP
jgi:hypothetical protein